MPETSRDGHETFSPTWGPPGEGHPTVVGDYRILGVLGTGGMGTVYAAEQEHPYRIVALKVIRSEFASEDAIRRFARQPKILDFGVVVGATGKTTEGEKIARDVLATTPAAQTTTVGRARRTVDTCVGRAHR